MSSRPRLAFVAPYGYPALAALAGLPLGGFDYVGGAEMQQARLARVLAARGHDVWMVSADFGQADGVAVGGVRVARAYRPFAGVPGVRFFHPRWSGIASALDRVRPDIVYQRTAGGLTGQVALWARAHGRRFVFACAHDFDTLRRSPFLGNPRDRWLFDFGLRHADPVLAQSEFQVESLWRHRGRRAELVRNLAVMPPAPRAFADADRVVWLGTVKPEKRPGWVVAAARELPEVEFVLAGGPPPPPMSDAEWRRLREEARTLPNLECTGFVVPSQVPALLRRASLFLHTSAAEGFPNTMLEAWADGVPSVSAVDPDGLVTRHGVGVHAESPDDFVAAVRALMADPGRRCAMGKAARAYVEAHHSEGAVAAALEAALGLVPPGAPAR